MKGRPKSIRKISFIPAVSGFRPYGDNIGKSRRACVFLLYEEYEALRLNDYEKHSQCESAAVMQVSRPTFTRIYMSAREKIAKAFVEGLQIVVEGGKVELDGNWYSCRKCKAMFSVENGEPLVCALCGSKDVESCALPETMATSETPHYAKANSTADINGSDLKLFKNKRGRVCGRGRCHRNGAQTTEGETDTEK